VKLTSEVRLSICIPVFNFGAFIGETLDSILPQCNTIREGVEVLVVDGASTDNTSSVVEKRAVLWPQIKYVQLAERGGIDADLAESVRLARGEYCWLFSGDDVMRKGSLERALEWLGQGHDVFLCKHTNCDLRMAAFGEHPVFRTNMARICELRDPQQRLGYMREGVTTEAMFSFMSSLIVRRDKWLSVQDPQEFMGSCWAHVARLLTAAQTQLRVCYVGETWLDRRGENDSFRHHGIVNRLRIAVDGYYRIANRFFGQGSAEAAEIRRMVRNDLGLRVWLDAKFRCYKTPALESRSELDRLVAQCYGDAEIRCWVARAVYVTVPAPAYQLLQRTYLVMPSVVRRMLRGLLRRVARTPQAVGIHG